MTPPRGRSPGLDLQFWPMVTAFGALWGTVEITLGSFLHTLRIPLSGSLLASIGAAILVAQRQVMPRRGVTLATGLVACLCKSVSPGGVILGPMIGISVEALLVELALLAWPRSRGLALVAGALAAIWAQSQKVFAHVVAYGPEVVRLWLAALTETARGLGVPPSAGWVALVVALGALSLLGGTLGLWGWAAGQQALARLQDDGAAGTLPGVAASSAPMSHMDQPPPPGRGWMALLALGCVALQFTGDLPWASLSLVLWLGVLWVRDRATLRRLWMPRFWVITLIFGLGGGLFLGKREEWILGLPFSMKGLEAGALMVVRGAFVFGLTSWASRALRRRDLERVLGRLGGVRMGTSIATAFGLLPGLKDRLAAVEWPRREGGALAHLLARLRTARSLGTTLVLETARLARDMER